jgi:hypothetical protein
MSFFSGFRAGALRKNLQRLALSAVAIINILCNNKSDTQSHSAYIFIENDDKN